MEHIISKKQDARTGLKFMASCQYSEYSYRTYVMVIAPSGRVISRNEIPHSADELSDCTQQPYYMVTDLVPDPTYERLSVQFADKRRAPIEVPLLLDGIDLPNSPRQQADRTARTRGGGGGIQTSGLNGTYSSGIPWHIQSANAFANEIRELGREGHGEVIGYRIGVPVS
jgi:hypothetical protein